MANKELEQNPVKYIVDEYEAAKLWRQPYEDRWKRFYKLYRNYRDGSKYPLKSNIFVPYIFSIVESVVPKMLGTIFNTRPIISVVARKGSTEDLSVLLERLLETQLDDEQLELYSKVLEFFKESAIYGTSFAKITPKFNNDELVSFDYIDVETLDLFNVFPDFRAKSIRRMHHIIELSYMEYDELLRYEEMGFYKNASGLVNKLESLNFVDEYKRERLTDIGILDEYGFDTRRKIVEVLQYWDRDKMYIIGARDVVLKEEDNPLHGIIPYVMARYIPVQHELYGIGIPEVAESLQEELNSVRNQRMDNVNLIINRMFLVNKYADVDMDSLISFPGNVIMTADMNGVQPLVTQDVTKSAYLEEDIIKRDIDNATGEWGYSRGEQPERRETATGIVRLQQASNIRFDTVVKTIEFTVLRTIARMFLWLDYHFLDPASFAQIVGPEDFEKYDGMSFYKQSVTDILKQYNFQPMGSSTTAIRDVRIQQIMQGFQLFRDDPYINQINLRKKVLDVLEIKDVNRLLYDTPEEVAKNAMIMRAIISGGMPAGQPGQGGQPKVGPPKQLEDKGAPPVDAGPPMEAALGELASVPGGGMLRQGNQQVPQPQQPVQQLG